MPLPQRAPAPRVAAEPPAEEVLRADPSGSPVHALQAAIDAAWTPTIAPALAAKTLCPGRLALIAALGLAAWVPVIATAAVLLR